MCVVDVMISPSLFYLRYLGTEIAQKLLILGQNNFKKVPISKNAWKKILGVLLAEEKLEKYSVLGKSLNGCIFDKRAPTNF